MILPQRKRFLAGVSLLLSTVGLVVVLGVIGSPQSWLGRAWSGVTVNVELLQSRLLRRSAVENLPKEAESQEMFIRLVEVYLQAETQNIDLAALGIKGKALMQYDPLIDKTLVWSRIENLPMVEGKIVRLWLTDGQIYLPVGVSEFVEENGLGVAYSVFVSDGNLKTQFSELVFSYDSSMTITSPAAAFLNLRF